MPSLGDGHLFASSWQRRKNIKKFIQSFVKSRYGLLVRTRAARALPIVCSLFLIPSLLHAAEEEITFRDEKIYVEGLSAMEWIGAPDDPDAELLLIYSNAAPSAVNTLRSERAFAARMLLVGGGGAGGYGTTGTSNPGGGGGGGEVKDIENANYAAGTYTITVGAGGTNTLAQSNGENGHPSTFSDGSGVLASALGGGGGGAKGDGTGGDDVATGGGGGGSGKLGVVGALGEDHKGGNSGSSSRSGGGGGAGGPGEGGSTSKAGDGGAGASSQIWADDADKVRRFGGGGGGGQSANSTADNAGAGVDGGGHGGYQGVAGEDGRPGTGGGGGGGGRKNTANPDAVIAGAGGSGLVVIRLTWIDQPIVEKEIDFHNQKIYVMGATKMQWVGDKTAMDAELILVFDNSKTNVLKTLRTDRAIEAKMLLVGGGGAGGYGTTGTSNPGGGGGGGQVLDLGNSGYGPGTYSFVIGEGGARTTSAGNGENGHPSFVTNEFGEVAKALGGGGGGAKGDGTGGDDVATGGGGGGSGKLGGVGALGEDHKGGNSGSSSRSGGGGGAGGPGEGGSTSKAGDGGAGASSQIWADDADKVRRFGGGGGGGQSANSTADNAGAGVDGGGHGGYQGVAGGDAAPLTGGGGGGGGRGKSSDQTACVGGAGGSGFIVVRLTYIEQPIEWKSVDVSVGGNTGRIWVDVRAEPKWDGGELVIMYSDAQNRGGLCFHDPSDPGAVTTPVWAQARILAVGGGGGGGMVGARNRGAGAGGGAGGFLDESGFVFRPENEFSITVGRGGAGGAVHEQSGGNGGNSLVMLKGGGLVMSGEALGGGGGGAHGDGLSGASGGGGSRDAGGNNRPGGEGVAGQGFAGGQGNATYAGAGGGGAGAAGADASHSGTGGVGRVSNITGAEVWYAGGGGGAYVNAADAATTTAGGAGGEGGGGAGAGEAAAQDGVNGLGGGGGGGVSYAGAEEKAGDGGSGVVIIRLTSFVVKHVPKPATTDFTYDGAEHSGVAEFFAYELSGDLVRSNANVYAVTATIADDAPFEWWDGGRGARTVSWAIMQAENEIRDFSYSSRRFDRLADPLDSFTCDWPKRDDMVIGANVIVEVRPEGGGEDDWRPWGKPEEKGNYEIRITIPEDPANGNWKGAGPVQVPFGTWERLSDLFTDRMEVTVSGNTSGNTALNDFPVPVRVREPNTPGKGDGYEQYSGFQYARAGATGGEIRFFDTNGDPVEHDVDTWNTRGESLVWVRVPTLTNTTTKLTMCWRRAGSIRLPDNDGTKVWKDYAGVWHLSKPENGKFADASGNGLDAVVPTGSSVETVDGKFGKAAYVRTGNLMAPDYQPLMPSDTNGFTYTGWYLGKDYATGGTQGQPAQKNWTFAGKKLLSGTTPYTYASGWCFDINNNVTYFLPYVSGNVNMGNRAVRDIRSNWNFFGFKMPLVGTNTTAYCYYTSSSDAFTEYNKTNVSVFANNVALQLAGQGFQADELRLAKVARTKEWLNAEWASLNKGAAFCTYGLVIREELKCDWWSTVPSLAKTVWHRGETPPTVVKGTFKEAGGNASVTYVCVNVADGTAVTNALPTELGFYRATFDHADMAGYRPQPHVIGFYVIEPAEPSHDLGGDGGDSGRILLMNADDNTAYPVKNQGWCAQSQPGTVTDGVTCWWLTAGGADDGTNNVMGGTSFELVRCADTNVLWTLNDCRQGNTFPTNDTETLSTAHCFLPSSSNSTATTARSITDESLGATRRSTGWLMMRNTLDAAIYSPCFTNGIGTVYFDAVNDLKSVAANADGYRIVLEVATETTDRLPPLDENCWEEDPFDPGRTNRFAKLEGMWRRVDLAATLISGTTYTDQPVTDCLALKGVASASTINSYFYRVHARLDDHRPIRFRILRVSQDPTAVDAAGNVLADAGYVLMDNLIVSKPQVYAKLEPYGRFLPTLPGDCAVGCGGALSVPFPSAADAANLTGRAHVVLPPNTEYAGKSPDEYISLAQMFYRWRHLGTGRDWAAATMAGVGADRMDTTSALDLPARAGDVEFYFVTVMKAPYYEYVDYTGLKKPVMKNGYSEEVPKYETRLDEETLSRAGRLSSLGTDWFAHVRDGASAGEGVTLELRGAISNDCPMRLVEDGTWRALLQIPTNAAGTCTFRFRGRNRQTAGATDYAENETVFGGGAEAVELPRNGILSAGGAATPFEVDHVSNYIEFRLGADASANPTWSASRAEYQNFNNWSDVWSSPESQRFSPGTNGVDDVSMQTETLDNSSWRLYAFEDSAWNELFTLVNYNDPAFPKETFYQNHKTPSVWNGYNVTFVSKNLGTWVNPGSADTKSGMAVKLQGQGGGILEYNKSNNPKGIEDVRFTARIGQSIGYDDISYSADQSRKTDYTFVCPVSMSRSVSDDTKAGDMSVGGAVSLFAYYRESKGCYEFRVTRAASGAEVLMELFKWHPVNGAMEQTRLCGQRFNSSVESMKLWNASGEVAPKYFGMFISAKTDAASKSTKVWGGLGKDELTVIDDTSTFSGGSQAANGYGGLYYEDKDADRLQSGSYGVAAKDCPAQFVRPRHYDWPVDDAARGATAPKGLADAATYKGGKYFKASGNKNFSFSADGTPSDFDYQDITDGFWELGQQIADPKGDAWSKGSRGLRTNVEETQDVVVMLQDKVGGDWFEAGRIPVSGYAFAEKTLPVHLTGDWNLRLTTGKKAMDIVIGEVRQRQWQGLDYENLSYGSDQFVYTQGVVESNDLRRAKETLLQPSRGLLTKPLSVRSPVLSGLGKVSFSYENADGDAEVWVQVATNSVEYNLTGDNGYNLSVTSVERGDPEPVGAWITVAKFGASDECPDGPLGKSGVKTVYLGWHDQANAPVKGVFRVFIPTKTVAKALVAATNATQNADYGRITVTGMTVTDEPGVSERSWRGWNLRTIGDDADAEGRMFLDDGLLPGDVGYGLACGLNNSINDLADKDAGTAAYNNPTIWSPTFETMDGKSRSIGSVSFRARLYYADDARETETGGIVSVWGATSSTADNWTKLVDIPVTSSTFSNFTWTALGENRYRAVKLEVSGPAAKTRSADRDRVIVDEIVLTEKLNAKIGFVYIRPFRTNLYDPVVIEDIESPNEQPLVGESWGVQTKLRLEQLGRDVSGLEVYLQTFAGESPWGYGMWKERGSERMRLEAVGDPKDGIFRSVGRTADALVQPVSKASTVQYMVILQYAGEGEEAVVPQYVEKEDWTQPSWYWPVDLNEKYGGNRDPDKFSPYTILDTVSPGRAWINEVNWNDGPKEETGTGDVVVTNQFIEICVPSGVDMTDWYLRATDLNANQWTMAMFGQQLPVRKISGHATNGFEFVVVESPQTQLAGGVRDPDGQPAADGAWGSDGPNGSAKGGTLNYSFPWQFELVRPSGIVEHQFVLQGTNEWAEWSFGTMYDGTNLVSKLNERIPSTKRFYAAEETSKRRDGLTVGSAGVVGGNSNANPPPGGEGTWANRLRFTAGRLNEGQIIPKDWFIAPSGTNAWVYLSVEGAHISQKIGDDTNRYTMVLVPQGVRTNVLYTAAPWYETATISVRDASGETRTVPWHRPGRSEYAFAPSGTVYITATEGFDSGLEKFNIGLEPGKSAYSRAVVNWLAKYWPDATPDDIRLAHYMNIVNESVVTNLTLTEMYWFDIPPVNSAGNPSDESEWWLRAGFTGIRPQKYIREGFNGVLYTNSQFDVKMYISNSWDNVTVYSPPRLQGLANERSDEQETYSGGWTSVTFKIRGTLINGEPGNKGFLPFRMFTFGPGSFTGPEADPPFTSTIEILDPFSSASPGHSYGWDKYPNTTPFWFKWSVDTGGVPDTVSTLKAKDTYDPVPVD